MSRREIPTIQEADGEELRDLKQMIIDEHLSDLEKFEEYILKVTTATLEHLNMPLETYREQKHKRCLLFSGRAQYITQDEMDAFKLMFAVNAIKLMQEEAKKER